MWRTSSRFRKDDRGAVAPTVALALFALIAAGGIAFDYARLAALDTELQNAADQAALAAATQLDGLTGARARATTAANNLVDNDARFANDGGGLAVTVASICFLREQTSTTCINNDQDANFVRVTVASRRANYALTPIVAAVATDIDARAMAGVETAVCRAPPLMICNPAENTDPGFDAASYAGRGLLLKAKGGGNAWAPGDFGFLAAGGGSGASSLGEVLGRENIVTECLRGDTTTTEPGSMQSVIGFYNVRFDIYINGLNPTCQSGSQSAACPPAANIRTDLVQSGSGGSCGYSTPSGNSYFDWLANSANVPVTMGYPRDRCHANSSDPANSANCGGSGRIGDGVWDANLYFQVNYPSIAGNWQSETGLSSSATRYDVYRWELTQIEASNPLVTQPGAQGARTTPICRASPAAQTDRRLLTVAILNCSGQSGRFTTRPARWVDVFLTEPTRDRSGPGGRGTTAQDIYVEIVGESQVAGRSVRQRVPYLVR